MTVQEQIKDSCFLATAYSKIHSQNKLNISSKGLRFLSGLWHFDLKTVQIPEGVSSQHQHASQNHSEERLVFQK